MGEMNIPHEARNNLRAIDTDELDKLIEQSLDEKSPICLRVLRLEGCGSHVASQRRAFEKALAGYGAAKAAKKLAETESCARRAGSDLSQAVQQMKRRVELEEKEAQLFYVDDQIAPPHHFSEHLTVQVHYRWRQTIKDEWESGSITFIHDIDVGPDHKMPLPERKTSASRQEQDRQDELYREWEHLMRLGLYSVRDFFREGGNAAEIPKTFQAKADSYSRRLNNFSAKFWPSVPQAAKQESPKESHAHRAPGHSS